MKKLSFLLCILLFCGGLGAVEEKTPEISQEISNILSGKSAVPEIKPEEITGAFHQNIRRAGVWFQQEKHDLMVFAVSTAATILAGVLLSMGVRRLTRCRKGFPCSLRHRFLSSLATPFIYLCVTAVIFVFMLPILNTLPGLYPWDARLFFTLQTLIAAWGGFELIGVFDGRLQAFARRPENNLDMLMVEIIRKVLKTLLVLITLLFIGQSIFKLNITTLLAGAGFFGVAVAFASRETLSNFFGTLVIILDRPFRCGDRIQINGIDGIVETVGMRSTRIQTGQESVYTVPNSTIAAANVENISMNGVIRYMFTLALTYDTPAVKMEEAMKILREITCDFHGTDREEYRPRIFFHSFAASSLNICVIMWLKTCDFAQEERLRTEVNLNILRRFNSAGIDMAYNTVTNVVQGSLTINPPSQV